MKERQEEESEKKEDILEFEVTNVREIFKFSGCGGHTTLHVCSEGLACIPPENALQVA
jgi:hypothetical protein